MRTAGPVNPNAFASMAGRAGVAIPQTRTVGSGHYAGAPLIAAILIMVVAVRVHEVLPLVETLRPALTVSVVGTILIVLRSRSEILGQIFSNRLFQLLLALMAWAIITAPFALWPMFALDSAFSLLLPILLLTFAILACEPNARNLRFLKLALMGGAAIHGLMLLVLTSFRASGRMVSFSSLDANDLAVLMVIAFPFSVTMAMQTRGRDRWMAILAAVVFLTVVVFSGSRGGALALVVAGLVFIASAKGVRRGLAFTILLVGGILTWVLAPDSFRTRMASITNLENDYNTYDYNGRKAIWARARGYIRQHPVAGVGIANFPIAEGGSLTSAGTRGKWSATHNSYLQVTSELGVVGAAIFLSILGIAVMRALALRRPQWSTPEFRGGQPELLAALAGFAAGGIFLSHAYSYVFYTLVAVTVFSYRVATAGAAQLRSAPTRDAPPIRGHRGFRSARAAQWVR